MTSVYVIEAQERLVKIGIAGNPQSRLAQLRTGTPFPLRLAHVEDVKELTAAQVEHMAHHHLAAHRTHGEWFAVSVDEAVQAIRHVSEEMRNPPGIAALRAAYEADAKTSAFKLNLTGEQIRGARAMARIEQSDLASRAGVSVDTIKRIERTVGRISANVQTVSAIVRALEAAGVEFIPENGDGARVRLRKSNYGQGLES